MILTKEKCRDIFANFRTPLTHTQTCRDLIALLVTWYGGHKKFSHHCCCTLQLIKHAKTNTRRMISVFVLQAVWTDSLRFWELRYIPFSGSVSGPLVLFDTFRLSKKEDTTKSQKKSKPWQNPRHTYSKKLYQKHTHASTHIHAIYWDCSLWSIRGSIYLYSHYLKRY